MLFGLLFDPRLGPSSAAHITILHGDRLLYIRMTTVMRRGRGGPAWVQSNGVSWHRRVSNRASNKPECRVDGQIFELRQFITDWFLSSVNSCPIDVQATSIHFQLISNDFNLRQLISNWWSSSVNAFPIDFRSPSIDFEPRRSMLNWFSSFVDSFPVHRGGGLLPYWEGGEGPARVAVVILHSRKSVTILKVIVLLFWSTQNFQLLSI